MFVPFDRMLLKDSIVCNYFVAKMHLNLDENSLNSQKAFANTYRTVACTCFLSQFCTVFRLADFTFYLLTLYSTLLMLYTLNSFNSHCQLQNYCDFFLPFYLSFFVIKQKPLWSQWTGVSRHNTTKTGAHEGTGIYIPNLNTNKCTTVWIPGQLMQNMS